jgi:signal transduction histidine kinase
VGLSLTRRIIEDLHGGKIIVRPRRGGGTVFEIDLPVVRQIATKDAAITARAGVAAR